MLDTRAAAIEEALTEQRTAEFAAVNDMVAKAEDSIGVNTELVGICSAANFDEWTKFKMEKTLQKTANDAAMQTLEKVSAIQRFEEQSARRKMAGIVSEVNEGVMAAIKADDKFAGSSINDAITAIEGSK
jgi:hypothetical protein